MPQINQRIDAIAADWASRVDREPLSADDEKALAAWLEEDTRHRGAFMRMRAIAVHSERARALGPNFEPDRFMSPDSAPFKKRVMWRRGLGLASAAAAVAVIASVGIHLLITAPSYDTRKGEVKVVSLSDGSVMTLNTASRVKIDFSTTGREVRLIEGEALFDVVRDSSRPFIVDAGAASVRAIGTRFTVRRLEDAPIQVIVSDGLVEVQEPNLLKPVRVAKNMQARIPTVATDVSLEAVPIAPEALRRELAWRDGHIAFEAERLAQAAVVFARYSGTRVIIDDPSIAELQVTGLFTATDPVTFARATATSLGLQARVEAGEVHLSR